MSEQSQAKAEPDLPDHKRKGRLLTMGGYTADALSLEQYEEAEKLVKGMVSSLHESERYLTEYIEGRVNAVKTHAVIVNTAHFVEEQAVKLVKVHHNKKSQRGHDPHTTMANSREP